MAAHDYAGALKKVAQAGAVGGLTPYEAMLVAQLRGSAAAGAGDYAQAAQAYEAVLASGEIPTAGQAPYFQAIAGYYDQAGDLPHTITWVNTYIAAGGAAAATRALLPQAYYQEGDFTQAEQAVWRDEKAAGTRPLPEPELQLLASAAHQAKDEAGYALAMQQLLAANPKPAYWQQAIGALAASPNFPDQLRLALYRLRLATGTLTAPGDYEDYAERAILAGEAGEAKTVIDQGFADGILTSATDAGHAQRLRTLAAKDAAQASADPVQQAKTLGGTPDGLLDLGVAYFRAGDMRSASSDFRAIPKFADKASADPDVTLARLWALRSAMK